jgi:anti-sigma factor RsiW
MVNQTITITVNLTEEELQEARALGLLDAQAVEDWLRERLARARDIQRIREIQEANRNSPDPLTPDEIEAEIQAYRAEKRARRASGD